MTNFRKKIISKIKMAGNIPWSVEPSTNEHDQDLENEAARQGMFPALMRDESLNFDTNYSSMPLSEIAQVIKNDWKKISFAAIPYLDAMSNLNSIQDNFYNDSGASVVIYFLSNATGWRGPVAQAVKKELNQRLKNRNDK